MMGDMKNQVGSQSCIPHLPDLAADRRNIICCRMSEFQFLRFSQNENLVILVMVANFSHTTFITERSSLTNASLTNFTLENRVT